MDRDYGQPSWGAYKLQNSATIAMVSGETKPKIDLTDKEIHTNWVELKDERDRCYDTIFKNELALLKFVGVKTYRDSWAIHKRRYAIKYGEQFEEHLHRYCEQIASRETDYPDYNPADVWRRIRDFINLKIEGDSKEETHICAAYADKDEKKGGWKKGKLKKFKHNIFNKGTPYKWDA